MRETPRAQAAQDDLKAKATPAELKERIQEALVRNAKTDAENIQIDIFDTRVILWDTLLDDPRLSPAEREYAELWSGIDKVVCSRTLQEVSTSRTRIEREFDVDAVRRLKEESELDIGVDGPELAAQAMAAGLVDECHVLFSPVVLGGGKKAFPDGTRLRLELLDRRRFGNGFGSLRSRNRSLLRRRDGRLSGPRRAARPLVRWRQVREAI